MYPNNLSQGVQIRTALDYASAAAVRNGAEFDMQGFDGVLMVVKFAAVAAAGAFSIKAQQDVVTGMGGAADLAGSGIAVANDDDDQIFILDIYRPTERFVRVVVVKDATNVSAEMAFYIGYGARIVPTTLTLADEVTYERHISPAEGTA
jgi:hypothetical protein